MMGIRPPFDLMFTAPLSLFTLHYNTVRGLQQASTYEATLLTLKGVGLHSLWFRAHLPQPHALLERPLRIFLPFLSADPEFVLRAHDVGKDRCP